MGLINDKDQYERLDLLINTSETYTSKEIEQEAIRLVKLFPPHKPLIKDSTRTICSVYARVLIYY